MDRDIIIRNLSVHAYDQVDWERVFDIVHGHMDNFRQYAAAIANIINRPPNYHPA